MIDVRRGLVKYAPSLGEVMLQVGGFHCRLILSLISAAIFLVELGPASAQLSKPEKERIGTTIAAEINRAITKHPSEGIAFREKVVGRLAQCGSLFNVISQSPGDPEAKKSYHDVAEISLTLSAILSEGIAVDRFKEIVDTAEKFMKEKFAAKRTPDSEREMNTLLRNCKSFHKLEEISGAVAELLPSVPQQDNAAAIEFAYEFQECSLYYALLAGGTLLQVPQNSGPLSPADRDKAVKSQVYMTKSKQTEVFYQDLARLGGVAETALSARRDTMFEQEKRVMTREWNLDKLHERYKDFCEYLLSDTGGKARLKEITQGNICGRLYTCW